MRAMLLLLLAVGAAASCSRAPTGAYEVHAFPTRTQVGELERTINTPGRQPLERYARFYWLTSGKRPEPLRTCEFGVPSRTSGRFIRAVYVLPHSSNRYRPGVHFSKTPPVICDGGCGVIDMAYDTKSKRVVELTCHAAG